jgi:hypothetical protein
MAGSVQGVTPQPQGPKGPEGPNLNRLMTNIEVATQAFKEAAQAFDTEAQGVSRSQLGVKAKSANETTSTSKKTETPNSAAAEIWAAAAAEADESEDVKKKKKKTLTLLEKKMAEMEALEGMIDESHVEEGERGIIKEFFHNMSKLRQLRRQLKQINEQKEYYAKLLEQEKRRQGQ